MSKSKINLEELSKDMDEIFNMLKEFEAIMGLLDRQSDMDVKSIKTIEHLSKTFKEKLDKKYGKYLKEDPKEDLDSKK